MRTFGLLMLALLAGPVLAAGAPSQDVVKACVATKSLSPRVGYVEIPLREINESEDPETDTRTTTIRFNGDEIGTWESTAHGFGLVYNRFRIPLDHVSRLSAEKPSAFNLALAQLGKIRERNRSYICITFNFEGLGQSGSFQRVRGVYLIDRTRKGVPSFYTVGKTESPP